MKGVESTHTDLAIQTSSLHDQSINVATAIQGLNEIFTPGTSELEATLTSKVIEAMEDNLTNATTQINEALHVEVKYSAKEYEKSIGALSVSVNNFATTISNPFETQFTSLASTNSNNMKLLAHNVLRDISRVAGDVTVYVDEHCTLFRETTDREREAIQRSFFEFLQTIAVDDYNEMMEKLGRIQELLEPARDEDMPLAPELEPEQFQPVQAAPAPAPVQDLPAVIPPLIQVAPVLAPMQAPFLLDIGYAWKKGYLAKKPRSIVGNLPDWLQQMILSTDARRSSRPRFDKKDISGLCWLSKMRNWDGAWGDEQECANCLATKARGEEEVFCFIFTSAKSVLLFSPYEE